MPSYQQRLDTFHSVSHQLTQYLHSLPADAWDQPSACDRWQVGDVIGHLIRGSDFYHSTVSRGLAGGVSSPPGRAPAGSESGASAADGIADASIAKRRELGDDALLPAFTESNDRLIGLLSTLDPKQRVLPCYHGAGLVPAESFIELRVNELTVHHWDIRSRFDAEFLPVIEGLDAALSMVRRSLGAGALRWGFWPGSPLETPVRFRFQVEHPIPAEADILVRGDGADLADSAPESADVTFRCETGIFVLLMFGRLTVQDARDAGTLQVEGDPDLAARFSQWFRGI